MLLNLQDRDIDFNISTSWFNGIDIMLLDLQDMDVWQKHIESDIDSQCPPKNVHG